MICTHFNFNHEIYLTCCQEYYKCYFCHNENKDHIVKFKDIQKMKCNKCNTEQDISNSCIQCNMKFAKNYCNKCKYWNDKNIYHCNECDICYIGNEEEFIHCKDCNKCFYKHLYNDHLCNSNEEECQICLESFKKRNEKSYYLKCKHKIHISCYNKYQHYCLENKKLFKCGLCREIIT